MTIAFAPQPPAAQPAPTPAAALGGFAAPATAAAGIPAPQGVLVPLELTGGDGSKVTVQLLYGPEYGNVAALTQLLGAMVGAGWPVRVFTPRQDTNGFGGRGGFNRGGGFSGGRRW